MTITITKWKLAVAVVAVVLIAPATVLAGHVFDDVDDSRFFAEPVEWASDNGITTGTSPTTFHPDRGVTRGESVTFLKRYDDNIVQPALVDIDAAQPFAVTAFDDGFGGDAITGTPTAYVTVTVTAPVAGHVTVNSTAVVFHSADGGSIRCVIVESTDIPVSPSSISQSLESAQFWETALPGSDTGTLSGTRTFTVAAGATVDYVLACQAFSPFSDPASISARNLTAIFTPAPPS